MCLNLDSEEYIFNFLLSREINEIEKKYIENISKLEDTISKKIHKNKNINLLSDSSIFHNNNKWINDKYIELIILQITLDLITDNIINFMEN